MTRRALKRIALAILGGMFSVFAAVVLIAFFAVASCPDLIERFVSWCGA